MTTQQQQATAQIIYADTDSIMKQVDALIRGHRSDPDMRARYELIAHWIKDLRELADTLTIANPEE